MKRRPLKKATFPGAGDEECFSPDREWMPRLVMIAKSTYVWLDQLSRKYGRPISLLSDIPDEELDLLEGQGFTGLWLIGLWERSRASQKIKQICGNPGALASAYAIYEYRIATDLGGEESLRSFQARATSRGIRLACDLVPNHIGLDSPWVIEHPDWFLSTGKPPFRAYTFTGPDLSSFPGVGIFLEDHYYDRSDAAVVFKRIDYNSGDVRYIFHGNDGTDTPWNDTAQLNFLLPEVREAVIKTILQVAGLFPVIRFDAAMILTQLHFQRLWFPRPGTDKYIPGRSSWRMSRKKFLSRMPGEFFREVVDRVTGEALDTLLLAEAFWLMEPYFVRTLGMHRVYNSAFMNFLMMEENAPFRALFKNVLQINPEILKRFANFLNNPDEETAAVQFGTGDKYFGACTLMVTLPGLPMFGHGQIEGFKEKYGMEFGRALQYEDVDGPVLERHRRDIFPLMRQRDLFCDVGHFRLYDLVTDRRALLVNEDVIAYSNRVDHRASLVVFHNRDVGTAGYIHLSVPYSVKNAAGENREPVQKTLADGLGLCADDGYFVIFREINTGLTYIRSNREIIDWGFYLELRAFETLVFLDFFQVEDLKAGYFRQVHDRLGGKGVTSMEQEIFDLIIAPLLKPLAKESGNFVMPGIEKFPPLLARIQDLTARINDPVRLASEIAQNLQCLLL